MDLNKAMIIGRLTRDPEARTTPGGQSVCSFSLATNFVWSDQQGQKQERVEYHNIVAWRKLADICAQYLKKGAKIFIEGRLQTRSWEDQTGQKKYRTEIIADNMIMLDRPGQSGYGAPAAAASADVPPPAPTTAAADDEIKVEDIPF